MSEKLKLVIYDMDRRDWDGASVLAWHFLKEFPDKIGIRNGCAYGPSRGRPGSMYVYRTKTSVVVRGTEKTASGLGIKLK